MEICKETRRSRWTDGIKITTFDKTGMLCGSLIPNIPTKATKIELRLGPGETWDNVFSRIVDDQIRPYADYQEYLDCFGDEASAIKAIDQMFYDHYKEIIRGEHPDFWLADVEHMFLDDIITLQYATPKEGYTSHVVFFPPEEEGENDDWNLNLEFHGPCDQTGFSPVYGILCRGVHSRIITEQLAANFCRAKIYKPTQRSITTIEFLNI